MVGRTALRYVIHSRIDSDFGWVGRWILQSPVHRRLHHRLNFDDATANYSLMPRWDRVFGTWRADGNQSIPIGVSTRYAHGFWVVRDMVRDYRDFFRAVWACWRQPAPPPGPAMAADQRAG